MTCKLKRTCRGDKLALKLKMQQFPGMERSKRTMANRFSLPLLAEKNPVRFPELHLTHSCTCTLTCRRINTNTRQQRSHAFPMTAALCDVVTVHSNWTQSQSLHSYRDAIHRQVYTCSALHECLNSVTQFVPLPFKSVNYDLCNTMEAVDAGAYLFVNQWHDSKLFQRLWMSERPSWVYVKKKKKKSLSAEPETVTLV